MIIPKAPPACTAWETIRMSRLPDAIVNGALQRAMDLCRHRGVRLTDLRRQVLALVVGQSRPIGAYDLLNELRQQHPGAAPPTVYRALDFLLAQGLIHKVERLSAYVACVHDEGHADPASGAGSYHSHATQFLICRQCGSTTELNDESVTRALDAVAARAGFSVQGTTIELEGRCARCAPHD